MVQLIGLVRLMNAPNCIPTPCTEFVLQPVEGALDLPDPLPSSLPLPLPPRPQLHRREGLGTRLVGGGSCCDCCAGGAGGGGGGGGGTALLTGSMCILHGGGGDCGGEGLPTVKRELIKYTKSREFKLACSEL